MKRIGIISYYKTLNYGSVLQACAMQMVIRGVGYKCEHIRGDLQKKFHEKIITIIKDPLGVLKKKTKYYLKELTSVENKNRRSNYEKFIKDNLKESPIAYAKKELYLSEKRYDAFVCGSDQIWAPNQFNEFFYINFISDKSKKIAYAPSIGLPKIPDELKDRVAELISDIGFVSIREQEGAEIVKELTGINAPVVLDPTLLITKEEWVAKIDKSKAPALPYILCLFLGENPEHRKAAEMYSQAKGYKIVVLPFRKKDYQWGDIIMKDAGPVDFIDLVNNAAMVFSDSFHGAAFAVNLNKPFCVFMRFSEDHPLCQNSRIRNLLQIFGLQDRLVQDDVSVDDMDKTINYETVNDILKNERQRSLNYLKCSLEDSLNESEKNHA
jgi:hypothetical protein